VPLASSGKYRTYDSAHTTRLTHVQCTQFNTSEVKIVEICSEFSLVGKKRNTTKVAEESYWAITQAVGRSRYGRSDSGVLQFGFKMTSLVYTHIVEHVSTVFRLAPDIWNLTTA
jgi:hypothetical protein